MKKKILTVAISMLATLTLVGFTTSMLSPKAIPLDKLESKPVELVEIKLEPVSIEINETEMFLNSIGMRESSNR